MHGALYVIGMYGRNLKQVYAGTFISSVAFSPDGQFLLIESANTTMQILVVNLSTLAVKRLQAPTCCSPIG